MKCWTAWIVCLGLWEFIQFVLSKSEFVVLWYIFILPAHYFCYTLQYFLYSGSDTLTKRLVNVFLFCFSFKLLLYLIYDFTVSFGSFLCYIPRGRKQCQALIQMLPAWLLKSEMWSNQQHHPWLWTKKCVHFYQSCYEYFRIFLFKI